jgi:NADH dehydrogenase FAD-containing subunit
MTDLRNIVILGASFAGTQSAQYIMKHLLPVINTRHTAKYHVYIINPSSDFYFRIASPRAATSASRLPVEKLFVPLSSIFDKFPKSDFTFIQASATNVNTTTRTVSYQRSTTNPTEETLPYHALIIATGSRTYHPAFSHDLSATATKSALSKLSQQISTAKSVVVVGGGPTGVETAAEIGEHINGKPGWFSTPERKITITLITSAPNLLPALRPAIAKEAEQKLHALGVDVVYNTRVTDTQEHSNGYTTLTLSTGKDPLETDVYIAAHGVLPNSNFLPPHLLDSGKYIETNTSTLRVDAAGPRAYAVGDVSSASRNTLLDLADIFPVFFTNLKRDLYAFDGTNPGAKPPGKDRVFVRNEKEMQVVTVGTAGGVGAAMGWRVPNWVIWLFKSRDMMVGMGVSGLLEGKNVAKEVAWKGDEIVA